MFFRKKKVEQQQVNIRNREKFDSQILRDANKIDERSEVESQESGDQQTVNGQQSIVEPVIQDYQESSYVEASEGREELSGNQDYQKRQKEEEPGDQQESESQNYQEEEKSEPSLAEASEDKIIQSKSGTVKVKRNWDKYSLPEYLRDEDTQMQMEIKQSPKEQYFKLKRKLNRLDTLLEILPYWKSWITMFSLVFSIFSVVMLSVLIIGNFNNLKNEIPLFYNQQTLGSDQVNKSVFLFVPVAAFFFNLMVIRLSMMVYNFDRKLVHSINLSLNLINLLLIIAVVQVISLILN